MKYRLDALLVVRKMLPSREKAQMAIEKGLIRVEGIVVLKASAKYEEEVSLEMLDVPLRYVSRGGLKLEKAIKVFHLDFTGKRVLDLGASTGGFTDCALQHGAVKVYAVDVGSNQLAESLRAHPSVVSYESRNIRDLTAQDIDNQKVDIIVADLSFVSITTFFPYFKNWLSTEGVAVLLIKPQFEIGEKKRLKGGIVKDEKTRLAILNTIKKEAAAQQLQFINSTPTDADGETKNIEYLCLFKFMS
jgi:23S rRNA (cytidine1920-2'-O)/16S rRNA (cytidine1409-2'-O)-methyltransferase